MKLTTLIMVFCLFNLGRAQENPRLKQFLWDSNFQDLISRYGEPTISVRDIGRQQRRLDARSFTEEQGFRVQVYAGTHQPAADSVFQALQKINPDSIYYLRDNGLLQVQVGNFDKREPAERMLDKLYYAGFHDAWIISATIHQPKENKKEVQQPAQPAPAGSGLVYAIQLFATRSESNARETARQFADQMREDIWINENNGIWKILAGKFKEEKEARLRLQEIKAAGFEDAWLTQTNE
ncbi:MAG: SPOR domain-containing protein [Calditrichia bacterium]